MEAEQDPKSDHGAHIDQTEIDGTPEQPVRKRRRKALSCVDCKRRKLKCDRIYPACGRCVRGGNPQSCRYTTQRREREVHSGDDQDGGVDVADSPCTMQRETIVAQPIKDGALSSLQVLMQSQQETISRLEARIAGLEKLVNLTTSSNVQSGISGRLSAYDPKPFDRLAGAHLPISDPPENRSSESLPPYHPKPNRLVWDNPGPLVPDWILFRGKAGFKVKFYGPTFAGHMVTQFTELPTYTSEALKRNGSLRKANTDGRTLRKTSKRYRVPMNLPSDQDLYVLLPKLDIIEASVRMYLDTLEATYRILHVPSFERDLKEFYRSPQQSPPHFIATILLIVAAMSCCTNRGQARYMGGSSAAREEATHAVQACGAWLDRQSKKHLSLPYFQIQCLLLLAKRTNSIKTKQDWGVAVNTVIFAASSGFHHDPKSLSSIFTPFEQEMRRRLWMTMLELAVLVAVERGMPSTIETLIRDTVPPLNLNDQCFDETNKIMPAEEPLEKLTSTTYLHHSASSLGLRVRLNSLLNDNKVRLSQQEVVTYSDMIIEELGRIDKITSENGHQNNSAADIVAQVLLQLQLYHFLLLLHQQSALLVEKSSSSIFSRHQWLEAANKIIELHSILYRKGNMTLVFSRTDLFHAAIIVCYDLYRSTNTEGSLSNILSRPSSHHIDVQCTLIEKAIEMLEDKYVRTGAGTSGCREFLILVNVFLLVKSKIYPGQERIHEERAANRISAVQLRILSMQIDEGSEEPAVGGEYGGTTSVPSMAINPMMSRRNEGGLLSQQISYERTQMEASSTRATLTSPSLSELPEYSSLDFSNLVEDGFDDGLDQLARLVPWGLDEFWQL